MQIKHFMSVCCFTRVNIYILMAESKESEVRIVITGANRGIGLEFVTQFLKRKNSTVIACCRNPGKANALNQLKEANKGRVVVAKVDVTNDEDIESLKQTVGNKPVDILLLNAGIIGKTKGPFQRSQYLEVFNVNCLGALLVGQALYDNVKLSNRKQIVGISSGAGSIADCGGGNLLPYRVSKTAMNMAFQSFAKQSEKSKDGVHTLLVNPGWVKTYVCCFVLLIAVHMNAMTAIWEANLLQKQFKILLKQCWTM
eukprot:534440_1